MKVPRKQHDVTDRSLDLNITLAVADLASLSEAAPAAYANAPAALHQSTFIDASSVAAVSCALLILQQCNAEVVEQSNTVLAELRLTSVCQHYSSIFVIEYQLSPHRNWCDLPGSALNHLVLRSWKFYSLDHSITNALANGILLQPSIGFQTSRLLEPPFKLTPCRCLLLNVQITNTQITEDDEREAADHEVSLEELGTHQTPAFAAQDAHSE